MIRDLKKLTRGGQYIADFRFDEGIRIREDGNSPCLCSNNIGSALSTSVFLIEVTEK